jgi:ParB family transcriptional regulator, chromosome partitioning protein
MRFREKTLNLAQIDSGDGLFRITTRENVDDLVKSIRDVGLLNTPLLIEKKTGYRIVCGFRRVEACRRLGWSHVKVRMLDSNTKRIECVKMAITDNLFQRPLNLIEQSRSIEMLSRFYPDIHSLSKELSVLGLPNQEAVVKKIKNLCRLPTSLQNNILSNMIPLTMALELNKMAPDDQSGFSRLFSLLKMSLNKQREVITLIKEVALREDISMTQILESTDINKILTHKDLDNNQKVRKIRVYLKQRRFPALTAAEKAFEHHKGKLTLGNGIKLIEPAHFEGTTYTLQLSFKSRAELKNLKTIFDALIEDPSLKKIID